MSRAYTPEQKAAHAAYDKARRAARTPEQREQERAYHRQRTANESRQAKAVRAAKAKARYDARTAEERVALRRQYLYALTSEQFDEMYARQDGLCAICSLPFGQAHVDHDHVTGKVRALLCRDCNVALGLFKDDPRSMFRAGAYVKRYAQVAA